MSPPLMGAFMPAKEIRHIDLISNAQGMALRGIEESEPTQIKQSRPALPITADNIRYYELFVGIGSEIILKYAQGVGGFNADSFPQGRSRKRSNGHTVIMHAGGTPRAP